MTVWNESLYSDFGWPDSGEIFAPQAIGAQVFLELAIQKIGRSIERKIGKPINIGVLSSNPKQTESPIALICEFSQAVSQDVLLETQRLAWNFSHSLLLITVEPHIIRKWSCWEMPYDSLYDDTLNRQSILFEVDETNPEITPAIDRDPITGQCLQEGAVNALSWVSLISGSFFREHNSKFKHESRADRMLLSNLKAVRSVLSKQGLQDEYCHDLLARIIFIQFLFDRKDSSGFAALNDTKLLELYETGVLSKSYTLLSDILENYLDAYALFEWLDEHFNGDLFPQPKDGDSGKRIAWEMEKRYVNAEHLRTLSSFVAGDIVLSKRQKSIWPLYSFDAIPLEFISSIYEEFVSGKLGVGVHYTKSHVVDVILDRVLPWNDENWNIKILDPACGSGIFLVKTYQRLIYRWKHAQQSEITPSILKSLLENNLFGVDKDENAIRVASFSLYLAMCDEIDPRYYWSDASKVRFPLLRGRTLVAADFFQEGHKGFDSLSDKKLFDFVIGNPPWGDKTVTVDAALWAKTHGWEMANNDFGVLFIAKGLHLVKDDGMVALVQSAGALLFNSTDTARRLQKRVFLETGQIESVINFAAFRWSTVRLFKDVKVPTCVVFIRNVIRSSNEFLYECPKPLYSGEDSYKFIIDNSDAFWVYADEMINDPWMWSALMWGGLRDVSLIRKLKQYASLQDLMNQKKILSRQGVIKGQSRQRLEKQIVGRRFLSGSDFPEPGALMLNGKLLGIASEADATIHEDDSSNFDAFALPQLLVKTSWTQSAFRFQAQIVDSQTVNEGIVATRSFISVRAENKGFLERACICYNSSLTTYYLFLTSGRFAFDRSEPLIKELRSMPLPAIELPYDEKYAMSHINDENSLDDTAFGLFQMSEADQLLVKDVINFKLPDFKGERDFPGYETTIRAKQRGDSTQGDDLVVYADVVVKVLKSAYGSEKNIGVVVFSEGGDTPLPMRLVAIYLNSPLYDGVFIEGITFNQLRETIEDAYKLSSGQDGELSYYQKCIRTYDIVNDGTVILMHVVKPDQKRYWLSSVALRDADEIVADLFSWTSSLQFMGNNHGAAS